MTTTSNYEAVSAAVKTIIDTEFAPEGFVAEHDNLHESLGRDRVEIGIAPVEEVPTAGNMLALDTTIEVKFYGLWEQTITPTTVKDPRVITNYAERFRRAIKAQMANQPRAGYSWYFDIVRVAYPNDPTGNKTRFVATIRAYGNNTGLVETTG